MAVGSSTSILSKAVLASSYCWLASDKYLVGVVELAVEQVMTARETGASAEEKNKGSKFSCFPPFLLTEE